MMKYTMVIPLKIMTKWKIAVCIILLGIGFVLFKYRDIENMHSATEVFNYWKFRLRGIQSYASNKSMTKNNVNIHDIELYLRMHSKDFGRYENYLVRSIRYFWPGNVSMVVVLDAENAEDRKLGKTLSNMYPYPRVEYQDPIDPMIYHGRGHERMQRDFFYPETKVKKKYVGFIDTDTVFVTRVTPDLLFEDGKPIIIANYGKSANPFWDDVAKTTSNIYKAKEIMRCMSFFPVIIKVEQVAEIRKYLEYLHGKPFDEIFKQFSKTAMSQFNIMCQYLWNFYRDEYKFYFHLRSSIPGKWKGEDNIPEIESFEFYQINITDAQKAPRARTSIHYRYHDNWQDFNTYKNVVKKGICYSGGFDICPEQCKDFNRTALQKELFCFEFNDWSWDPRCMDEQKKHYSKVAELWNSEAEKAIKEGCDVVDKLSFK